MSDLKVGSIVWEHDTNFEDRTLISEARFRSGFRGLVIDGGTTQSWLIGVDHNEVKIRKRDLTYRHWTGDRRRIITSQQEIDDLVFVDAHRHKISRCIEWTRDVALLREVAELIGYDEATGKAERG